MAQHLKRTILDIISFAAIFVGYFVHVLGPTSDLWRGEGSCKDDYNGVEKVLRNPFSIFGRKPKAESAPQREERSGVAVSVILHSIPFVNCSG